MEFEAPGEKNEDDPLDFDKIGADGDQDSPFFNLNDSNAAIQEPQVDQEQNINSEFRETEELDALSNQKSNSKERFRDSIRPDSEQRARIDDSINGSMLLEIEEKTGHLQGNLVSDFDKTQNVTNLQSSRDIPQIHLDRLEDKDGKEIEG